MAAQGHTRDRLTPLEIDVLRAFQVEFGAVGFPSPGSFTVERIERTAPVASQVWQPMPWLFIQTRARFHG